MGGYAPPPQEEWRPATAAEADYLNRVGRENRANVGLGSSYGRSAEYEQYLAQQEQIQPVQSQRQVDANRNQQAVRTAQARGSAYEMAMEAERTGRVLDPYVERKAREQGYGGNVLVGDLAESRQTVPTREYEPLPSTMPSSDSKGFGETITGYVPYGRGQTELERVKVKYTPYGEVGFYQKDPTRDTWRLVSSGSAAALQSGQFTRDQPQTPLVFTQAGGGTVLSPRANVGEARKVQANPQAFSRLGAESYGGFVLPLDNRTVQSTGAKLSTYDNQNNLANLVDPFAVNVPKAQREPVTVPWGREISASTPAISPVTPPQEKMVAAPKPVATPTVVQLKAPFKSEVTHTYIPPSGETTLTIPFTEIAVFKGVIPGFTEVEKGYLQKPKVLTTVKGAPTETKSAIGMFFPNAKTTRISTTPEGLATAPEVPLIGKTYSGGSPEVDALETNLAKTRPDIESRKSRLESIAAKNTESVNGELVWKGPEDEYYAFKSDTELLEKDVSTYNADVERFNVLAEKNPTFKTKYDLTKQSVTPTITYEREGQSGYDVINAGISSKIQTKLPTGALNVMEKQEIVFGAMAERDPFLAPAAVGISEMTYGIKNPLTAAASWGVGFGIGKIVRVGTTAMPVVKKVLPRAAPVIGGSAKLVGGVLVAGYGADVASRSTEGFTNFKPVSVAQKAIPIATYEVLPMTSGFKWGYDTFGSARALNDALPKPDYSAPSRYERGMSLMDNEAAMTGGRRYRPVDILPAKVVPFEGKVIEPVKTPPKVRASPQGYVESIDLSTARVNENLATRPPESFRDVKTSWGVPAARPMVGDTSLPELFIEPARKPSRMPSVSKEIRGSVGSPSLVVLEKPVTATSNIPVLDMSTMDIPLVQPKQGVLDIGGKSSGKMSTVVQKRRISENLFFNAKTESGVGKVSQFATRKASGKVRVETNKNAGNWMTQQFTNAEYKDMLKVELAKRKSVLTEDAQVVGVTTGLATETQVGVMPTLARKSKVDTALARASGRVSLQMRDVVSRSRQNQESVLMPKFEKVQQKSPVERQKREPFTFVGTKSVKTPKVAEKVKTTTPRLPPTPIPRKPGKPVEPPKVPPIKEPPGIPFLPGGGGFGGSGFQNPQYFRGFKERSPTWTVEEMSSSLFTGQLGPAKRKPAPQDNKKQGRTKKVRNIRR